MNITIPTDTHDQAKAMLARMPAGPTFSAFVTELVATAVRNLEPLVDAYEKEGTEGMERAVESSVGRLFLAFHTHGAGKDAE